VRPQLLLDARHGRRERRVGALARISRAPSQRVQVAAQRREARLHLLLPRRAPCGGVRRVGGGRLLRSVERRDLAHQGLDRGARHVELAGHVALLLGGGGKGGMRRGGV
jgi:hypothetical protein